LAKATKTARNLPSSSTSTDPALPIPSINHAATTIKPISPGPNPLVDNSQFEDHGGIRAVLDEWLDAVPKPIWNVILGSVIERHLSPPCSVQLPPSCRLIRPQHGVFLLHVLNTLGARFRRSDFLLVLCNRAVTPYFAGSRLETWFRTALAPKAGAPLNPERNPVRSRAS
jgi:hypothetical protein